MKKSKRLRNLRLSGLMVVAMMFVMGGASCGETQSPMDTFLQAMGDFFKGMIDVGLAFVMGH